MTKPKQNDSARPFEVYSCKPNDPSPPFMLITEHDRIVAELEQKLATARKVIEKLRYQRDLLLLGKPEAKKAQWDAEIEAIERGEK